MVDRERLVREAARITAKECQRRGIQCWAKGGTEYTTRAQEIFNRVYDEVEAHLSSSGQKRNPKGNAPNLLDIFTEEQWGEIYYALETKAKMIKNGGYGPEEKRGENKRWIEDLTEIMDRISSEVDV